MLRRDLDPFTRQYLETALWSSTDHDTGEPLDEEYSVEDFADGAINQAITNCDWFRAEAGDMLDEWPDETRAAHDFWLTHNRHGAGFWDGDWPINGDKLTDLAHRVREFSVYPGDDGKLHLESDGRVTL